MKKIFVSFNYLVFLSILFTAFNSFATFTIMPVEIDLSKNDKIATMTLQNNDAVTKNFQLVLLKRQYKNGKEEYVETKDLIATPIMFTLHGHKTQLIRISKNTANYSKRKNDYRISVKQLPHRTRLENGITSTINFVVEFNIPITISS